MCIEIKTMAYAALDSHYIEQANEENKIADKSPRLSYVDENKDNSYYILQQTYDIYIIDDTTNSKDNGYRGSNRVLRPRRAP